MPRLPTSLLRRARSKDPLLVPLLKTCRDIPSACSELRWLREHVDTQLAPKNVSAAALGAWHEAPDRTPKLRHAGGARRRQEEHVKAALLRSLVHRRARGIPLQYLIGTEYFGDLELECQKGVLIPRPETAAITSYLARCLLSNAYPDEKCHAGGEAGDQAGHRDEASRLYDAAGETALLDGRKQLRILDLCTGTGCVPLLLSRLIKQGLKCKLPDIDVDGPTSMDIQALGIDISTQAVRLARRNLWKHAPSSNTAESDRAGTSVDIAFERADVLAPPGATSPSSVSTTTPPQPKPATPTMPTSPAPTSTRYLRVQPDRKPDRKRPHRSFRQHPAPASPLHNLLMTHYPGEWDILTANSPYISPSSVFSSTTAKSVRAFEPRVALVPSISPLPASMVNLTSRSSPTSQCSEKGQDQQLGDVFYPHLLRIAEQVGAKVLMMEVGDSAQAMRVARLAGAKANADGGASWEKVEVWDDGVGDVEFGGVDVREVEAEMAVEIEGKARRTVKWIGKEGREGRAVVCLRGDGVGWMSGRMS